MLFYIYLNSFGSLDNFNVSNYMISKYIKEMMKQTNFKGISVHYDLFKLWLINSSKFSLFLFKQGLVTFNDQGDRISEVKYEQLQSNSISMNLNLKLILD